VMIPCCVFLRYPLSFLTHCAFAYLFVCFSLVGAFRTVFSLVRYVWDAEGSICWRSAVGWSFLIFDYYPLLQVMSASFVFLFFFHLGLLFWMAAGLALLILALVFLFIG